MHGTQSDQIMMLKEIIYDLKKDIDRLKQIVDDKRDIYELIDVLKKHNIPCREGEKYADALDNYLSNLKKEVK